MDDFKPANAINDISDEEEDAATVVDHGPHTVIYSRDDSTLVEGLSDHGRSKVLGGVKASMNASIQQLHYNRNKLALDRVIITSIELLEELSEENNERPIFFPIDSEDHAILNSAKAHLALLKSLELESKVGKLKPDSLDVPKLQVLKVQLKLGPGQGDVSLTLDKKTISGLLEQKIRLQIKYLENLKDRVDDTSSKVFVTGNLNSGKSTFCNTLLRRKVLPEDQQPCTSVFCEVIDAKRENHGIEEVHAIPIGSKYDRLDETTFEKHALTELEELVQQCDKYALLKVYVTDKRNIDHLLLANGVIDIKLIDAPGLNMDLYQTTQVFSRQEEIDLVVFVVLAENHFTLSAKEFIAAAAAEKRYVFVVVNRFDNIRDQEKCKRRILDQIKDLSPETHKNAAEFVHFVSSTDAYGGDGGDDPGDDDHGGNDDPNSPDFDALEASLRKFILDKRAISKLLPAKDFLTHLLSDMAIISDQNEQIWSQEVADKTFELENSVSPQCADAQKASDKVHNIIMRQIELVCLDTYDNTRNFINQTIRELGSTQIVKYVGLSGVFEYAIATQDAMVSQVLASVSDAEDLAREVTEETVAEVVKEGKQKLGDEFLEGKRFNSSLMFTGKQKAPLQFRDTRVDVVDFFDPSIEGFLVFVGLPPDLVSRSCGHLEAVNPTAIMTGFASTVDTLKTALPQSLTLHALYSLGKILGAGAIVRKVWDASHVISPNTLKYVVVPIVAVILGVTAWYLISDIPNAYPRNVARKLRRKLETSEYSHQQATRVAKEVRHVLNFPARQVQTQFQTSIDKKLQEKKRLLEDIHNAGLSVSYFKALNQKIKLQQSALSAIELESFNSVE